MVISAVWNLSNPYISQNTTRINYDMYTCESESVCDLISTVVFKLKDFLSHGHVGQSRAM